MAAIRQLARKIGGIANHAFHIEGLRDAIHGHGVQLDGRAAIIKAALINLDALVACRMVHFHTFFQLFASCAVMNDDIAGKQLGHASGVVLHNEFFELYRKWQLLQQDAIRLRQDSCTRLCTL